MTDYAAPLIKLENLLRQIHDMCLEKHYKDAAVLCGPVIAEARILAATLTIMEEVK
jgi:hypothetical protein